SPARALASSSATDPPGCPRLVPTAPPTPAARRIASWPASCSRQPRAPQRQRGPSGSTVTCPTSPAKPLTPRNSSPPITMPAPTPISPETWTKSSRPSWPPNHSSPRAARLASLSTSTGRSRAASPPARISATGTSAQPRVGASPRRARRARWGGQPQPPAVDLDRPGHGHGQPGHGQPGGLGRGDRVVGHPQGPAQHLGRGLVPVVARPGPQGADLADQVGHAHGQVVDVDLQPDPDEPGAVE